MRKISLTMTVAVLTACMVFTGCKKDDPEKNVKGIRLNKTEMALPEDGGNETLTPTLAPVTAENKAVTWSVTGGDAVTVDQNGKVTAVKKGTAKVIATATDGGLTSTCPVTVNPAVALNNYELALAVGASETLETTVVRADTASALKVVVWSSSNEPIATVDAEGVVTAVAEGEATITAITADGKFNNECIVTVSAAAE